MPMKTARITVPAGPWGMPRAWPSSCRTTSYSSCSVHDVGGSLASGESVTEQFSREELEKAAIRAVVAEKHLCGLDHRDDEFAALFYEIKESVRLRKTGSELAEQIGRSSLLELICASNLPADESRTTIAATSENPA